MAEEKQEKQPKTLTGEIAAPHNYVSKKDIPTPEQSSDVEKVKGKLEDFKKALIKKYNFTIALSILPGNSCEMFEEDEAMPKEVCVSKPMHMLMIMPEEQYKNLNKIKPEVVKMLKDTGENVWVHIKTPVDLWNYGLDSKFEFIDAIAASFPLYDKGFLGALRVASIHKSLVMRKFEKYVASYVIGGSLVRGTAIETSDVDTFVIIDDTDVKRMSRIELLEKLRGIIYDYIREATALAGVKNMLSVQVYLLTDFWQNVKDAHPVMFTFIRDGIPFYDRGTFIPWKLLLKMGKIKPSPEAVDMYMKSGDQTQEIVGRRLIDAMIDVYYGVLTPAQAMMMLAGYSPPTHKEAPRVFKETFYDKEKLVDLKHVKILEKAVKLFKDYEHGTLKSIKGSEIDVLLDECKEFNVMIKDLRGKIEKRMHEEMAKKVHSESFSLLKNLFGDKSETSLVKDLDDKLVKTGKMSPRTKSVAKELLDIKDKKKVSKMSQSEMQRLSRDATELIEGLIEYSQRKELVMAEKGIIQIKLGDKKADIVLTDSGIFISSVDKIQKIKDNNLVDSDKKELDEALLKTKDRMKLSLSVTVLDIIKKHLGNFEIIL